jgi:hypothetical protein
MQGSSLQTHSFNLKLRSKWIALPVPQPAALHKREHFIKALYDKKPCDLPEVVRNILRIPEAPIIFL